MYFLPWAYIKSTRLWSCWNTQYSTCLFFFSQQGTYHSKHENINKWKILMLNTVEITEIILTQFREHCTNSIWVYRNWWLIHVLTSEWMKERRGNSWFFGIQQRNTHTKWVYKARLWLWIFQCVIQNFCNNTEIIKKLLLIRRSILRKQEVKPCNANLGLESLIAKVDDGIRVIVHNVSATLAWTSGGLWSEQKGNSCQIIYKR